MMKKNRTAGTTYIMWSILTLAVLKNCHLPAWANLSYGNNPTIYLDDMLYFFGVDVILLLWAHFAVKMTNTIIAGILLRLAIGKIIDEFIDPYGYHWSEAVWDICVGIWAIYAWIKRNRRWEENTVK